MPVLGVVVTLSEVAEARERALRFLRQSTAIETGVIERGRLPIVLNTYSRGEDKALWAALEGIDGITHLELTSADFSDLTEEPS